MIPVKKKGQMSFNFIIMIPRLIFVFIVCFAIAMLIRVYIVTEIDLGQVESHLMMNRLLNSPSGFIYERNGRHYPEIIDPERLKDDILDEAFTYKTREVFGAKILLKDAANSLEWEAYVAKDVYNKLIPSHALGGGGGGSTLVTRTMAVQYYDSTKDEFLPAVLEIELVMRN